MNKAVFRVWLLIPALVLFGCSIDVSQATEATSTPIAQGGTVNPVPTGSTPTGIGTTQENITGNPTLPSQNFPVTWGNLNLSGKLIYTAGVVENNQPLINVQSLDLSTGKVATIFQTAENGWLDAAAVSPDGQQLVISYAPPLGVPYGGLEALYIMPLDGSKSPQLLFAPLSDQDQYYQPVWSPDGQYVYFTHIKNRSSTPLEIMRISYQDRKLEGVADNSYWPRLSGDGTRLTYVSRDAATGTNQLFIALADGTNAQQILLSIPSFQNVIDVPMFSTDNQTIYFSAPDVIQSSRPNWFDRLLGITVASADGTIPSDWWSVPITGGVPRQLTHTQSLALYGSFSPDQKYIASYTANGIFVMKPDGSGVTVLVSNVGGIAGTVDWIP